MRVQFRHIPVLAVLLAGLFSLPGCNTQIAEEDLERLEEPRVQPYFNSTGTREGTQRDLKPDQTLIEVIDRAESTVDIAAYGFSRQNVIDAVLRAHNRGVRVRIAGDAGHLIGEDDGFVAASEAGIPIQVGNQHHIMHDKIFIIDDRWTFAGTGNITDTGFERNTNNWVLIDSQPVAADFKAEFEQMFAGRFSNAKREIKNGNDYQVGDTRVEVFFSPQEDGMGKILSEVRQAHTSVHFQIFAFTKDELGSLFVTKHQDFLEENQQLVDQGDLPADYQQTQSPLDWPNKVVGVLDRSQLHGNDQYHEGYRMQAFGVPMLLDGNENSRRPGDYQAGGGRLHTKTMILDYGTDDARVLTGSFNWSASATIANDEFLLVLHGERIAEAYMDAFREIWKKARPIPQAMCYFMKEREDLTCSNDVGPKDVVISEVHWAGWNEITDSSDHTGPLDQRNEIVNDQFVELYNPTDSAINLSMYTLTNGEDFVVGFTPGTVIRPGEYFLLLDHNTEVYAERDPQRGVHAFRNGDFVLNRANDPRFPRLDLKYSSMDLDLRDASGEIIDVAGDDGPAFWGGTTGEDADRHVYSMERKIAADGSVGDGDEASSWKSAEQGADESNINPDFRDIITASPGEPNSGE